MKIKLLFLKLVCGMGSLPLLFLALTGPRFTHRVARALPHFWGRYWLVVFFVYGLILLAFWGLYQLQRILHDISQAGTFTEQTGHALYQLQQVGSIAGTAYVLSLPLFYLVADREDAPGIIFIGLTIILISLTVAVTANVLGHQFKEMR